jgi:hypothetical protein
MWNNLLTFTHIVAASQGKYVVIVVFYTQAIFNQLRSISFYFTH